MNPQIHTIQSVGCCVCHVNAVSVGYVGYFDDNRDCDMKMMKNLHVIVIPIATGTDENECQ